MSIYLSVLEQTFQRKISSRFKVFNGYMSQVFNGYMSPLLNNCFTEKSVLSGQFVGSSSAIVSSFSTFSRTIPLYCVAPCFIVVIVMDNHTVVMDNDVALLL